MKSFNKMNDMKKEIRLKLFEGENNREIIFLVEYFFNIDLV